MKPTRLPKLMQKEGKLEAHDAGKVFHAQEFTETMYMLKKGFVSRYQITDGKRVIELIYGPGHIFPLSQLYRLLFDTDMNQDNIVYVYQAMTDIEIWSLQDTQIMDALEKDPLLYEDLFYEAGLRLRANISRLASNALHDDYKKVTHQLVSLAEEFGETKKLKGRDHIWIAVPLTPKDMAEQLNISTEVAEAVMANLEKHGLITIQHDMVYIPDMTLLQDAYLIGTSVQNTSGL